MADVKALARNHEAQETPIIDVDWTTHGADLIMTIAYDDGDLLDLTINMRAEPYEFQDASDPTRFFGGEFYTVDSASAPGMHLNRDQLIALAGRDRVLAMEESESERLAL